MISRIPRHWVVLALFLITFSTVSYSFSHKDTINVSLNTNKVAFNDSTIKK